MNCTSTRFLDITAFLAILIFLSPYFFLQEQVYIATWDNLDSEVPWFKILAESGKNWSTKEVIPNIFNGLTRLSYQSNLNFYRLLYYIGPFFALVVNKVFTVIIGFVGMKMFLSRYVFKRENKLLCYGVALCFAFLPFWPSTSLSFASLPLAFYIFLDIRRGSNSFLAWLVVFLLPFFSDFTRVYIFFIVVISCLWLYDLLQKKSFNLQFFLSIFTLLLLFLLVEYRLIFYAIEQPFRSHREEFIYNPSDALTSFKMAISHFIFGQAHVKTLHSYIIFPITIVIAVGIFLRKLEFSSRFFLIVFILIMFSAIYGLYYFAPFSALYHSPKNPLGALQIHRFYWLNPFLWYSLFAIELVIIQKKWRKLSRFLPIIIMSQLILIVFNSPQFRTFYKADEEIINYKEFYSEALFNKIEQRIPEEKEEFKTVSFGIQPAIAQYNGFYTLDGYIGNYPLAYKYEFREIIDEELDKSKELQKYYDGWGSKVYLFSSELGENYTVTKNSPVKQVSHLKLNYGKLKEMGGLYIFSAVRILNNDGQLRLIDVFENEASPWRIYLYKIE